MTQTLQNPFQYWGNPNKAAPVSLGLLYVGLIDEDPEPELNQVDVFAVQPDGTELQISQPVSLLAGGIPSFNGSPVQLKINTGVVSVKVLGAGNEQPYYTPRYEQYAGLVTIDALADINSTIVIAGQVATKLFTVFDTVAQMVAGITPAYVGRRVNWLGYYAVSDGGGGWGIVKSGAHTHDGGKIISVSGSVYVEQNINGFALDVRKYGVRGNGITNDTVQMQRCLESGNKNICAPEGVYIFDDLTIPDWVTIEGVGYQPGVGGGDRTTEFRFNKTDIGNAITLGSSPVFRNILFINTGGTYDELTKTLSGTLSGCIKLSDNAVIEQCAFLLWRDPIRTGANTFYLNTDLVIFNRCTNGYIAEGTSPYNININRPQSALTETFIAGIGDFTPRNIKISGGSIEGYTTVAARFIDLSIFGTYFESEPERTVTEAISPQLDGSTVSIYGALIFMNETDRFVNASGLSNVGITSSGNTFSGAAESGAICYYLPDSGSINLSGDTIDASIMDAVLYVDSVVPAAALGGIRMPNLYGANAQVAYSNITFTGQRGSLGGVLTAEPAVKVSGQMFLADGDTWDPLAIGDNKPYYVMWRFDAWGPVSG